ncbi:putative heavy metal-associated domain, HMA [Rosa chinensis]|uniref:Putative heavy metal-associated domain, HMA n=1 Tax=Rosa chinensis TaxID=74649 RepID=A0A2P6R772_ROSCH|nr:heavy metal-associated isoprenylated plant protein 36 [Rosa chinensis]PRQ42257.1 putative heavy metal-associated domain, HMA [Rosa chinensis]
MASTTEPKGEIQEVSEDVSTETLKYKTWVLKVSIHCGACSKKVTKILKKIDGVYITRVDYLQQKVTVIGNVEAETLIKTLTKKTTKHVELLWPDPKDNSKDKKQSKPKGNEKQSEISEEAKANHGGGGGDKKKGKEPVKDEVVEVQESGGGKKNFEVGSSSNSKGVEEGNVVKPHEGGGGGGEGKLKEAQTGSLPSQSQPAAAEKQSGGVESEAVGEKSGGGAGNGGGGGGKKKKGKGQNGNHNVNAAEGELVVNAPSTGSPPVQPGPQPQPQPHGPPNVQSQVPNVQRPIPVPASHGPPPQQQVYEHPYYPRQQQQQYEHPYPRQQHYEHPYPMQQQQHFTPVHAMNYNAAHPSISYGAAGYAPQPVYSQSHTYANWSLGNEVDPPAYDLDNLPPAPPFHPPQAYPPHPYNSSDSDTYAFFSDENPNGCGIM